MIYKKIAMLMVILGAALSGCYVVPIQPHPAPASQVQAQVASPMMVLTARLYPVNEAAAAIGRISGTISRPDRGHGVFSLVAGNESFSGEATRAPHSSKGIANAAGNAGGFLKCEYTMTNATSGSGSCAFSNGARFDMHITSQAIPGMRFHAEPG